MIYITGDTHCDFSRFEEEKFPIQTEMTKNDYVIMCGDFGGVRTFKRWYFGHYHDYKQVNSQFTLLYEDIVPLEYESVF